MDCKHCKIPFESRRGTRYCSDKCRKAHVLARDNRRRRNKYVPKTRADAWIPCGNLACGKIFNAVEGHRHGGPLAKYCCKKCCQTAFHHRNPPRILKLKNYGITLDTYKSMLNAQGDACAICQAKNNGRDMFCIDHDHNCCAGEKSCGKCIRGLLCHACNQGIGLLKDNQEILDRAKQYLKKSAELIGVRPK